MGRAYHPVDADRQGSLAILESHTPNTAFESVASASPPDSSQFAVRSGSKLLKVGPHYNRPLFGAAASIVTLVTILALLALCRTNQRRLNSGAAVRRSLSDAEDEQERSEILERCLDMEEEFGFQPTASEHSEETGTGKARLVAMLYESAAAFEQVETLASQRLQDEALSPLPKVPRLSELWPSNQGTQAFFGAQWSPPSGVAVSDAADVLDAGAWVDEDLDLAIAGVGERGQTADRNEIPGLQQNISTFREGLSTFYGTNAAAGQPTPLSGGRANNVEHGISVDAWLDDSLVSAYPQAFHQGVVGTAWQTTTVEMISAASTSAGLVGTFSKRTGRIGPRIPLAGVDQEGEGQSTQMAAAQQILHPDEAFADTSDTVERSESDAVAQATTSGGGEPFGAKDIRRHPFVRLPAVNLEDVHLRYNGALVLSFDLGVTTPMEAYMKMRSLFAKDSLTAEDVSTLMVNADYLAKYAVAKLARPCRKRTAGHLLMRLSALLMAFDYLVCTIKLLGDHMDAGSWWPAFVQRFRTDYFFPEDSRRPKSKILNNLVNRLSAALSIYKQARRPALEEVIELKRAILNHASKDSQLANPLWKLWIEDDKQFSSSSGHVESPSDVQARSQEDPKHS